MADEEYRPQSQDTDPAYNQKGGVVVVPGSPLANEMLKWEQFPSKWGQKPGNPYVKREFPKMLYRAQKIDGKPFIQMPEPMTHEFQTREAYKQALARKSAFDRECQRVVQDEAEFSRAHDDGWRDGPDAAIQRVLDIDANLSQSAAEREYSDSKMSEPAQREAKAAKEAVGGEHLGEIKETPVRRRGRPKGSKNKPKA